jgi:hypothetical protein
VVGTVPLAGVKIDGQNRLGHTSDAARRVRGASRTAPASKQGVMPWLLDGAAPPISEAWAVPVDLMRVGRVWWTNRGRSEENPAGGVDEVGVDEVAAEGTPAR